MIKVLTREVRFSIRFLRPTRDIFSENECCRPKLMFRRSQLKNNIDRVDNDSEKKKKE